jgi:NDP-sugar pyrophosphorylase family protein
MEALVMAGGKGKRLRPLTYAIPKPLLPIGERPILEILLAQLKASGFTAVYISTGYKAELIRSYFGDGSRVGLAIEYVHEPEELGTAGALALIKDKLTRPFLMVNGDVLTKLDYRRFFDFHVSEAAAMTVGGVDYRVKIPFGVIESENGVVSGVTEKPTADYLVAAGIYALNPEALDSMSEPVRVDVPDLMMRLVKEGKKVLTYRITDPWLDVGKLSDYERASEEVASWGGI